MTPPDIRPRTRLAAIPAILLPVAIAALCLGLPSVGHSQPPAPCPSAIVQMVSYSGAGPFPVEAAFYDSSFTQDWTARVTFTRTLGYLAVSGTSSGRMTASVRIVETFDVVGVPVGTSLPAEIEFQLDGTTTQNCGGSGCGVRLEGTLVVGPDSVAADANQSGPGSGTRTLAAVLHLPVTFVAGTPVHAEFYLNYGTGPGAGGAHAEGFGNYRVSGLPPGVRAVACMGGDVTPVHFKSWGALKTRYR